jgi:hypothetical protein
MTSKESGVGRDAGVLVSRFPGRLAEQEQAVKKRKLDDSKYVKGN